MAVMSHLNNLITRVPLNCAAATFNSLTHTNSNSHSFPLTNKILSPLKSTSLSINSINPIRAMASSSNSGLEETVKNTVADNPVVVYSKSWCSFSMQVKSLFKKLGVEPFVVELDEMGPQGEELQNVLARLTGQRTVPNVFIGNKHIGGCTETMNLYGSGELESLLTNANAKKSES